MTGVGASGGTTIFGIIMPLMLILQFALYGLGIYCLISLIQFMKKKTEHDKELIRKLDSLIQINSQKD